MIYVTRHGETTWNVQDIISGRSDVPLTEKGYQQAAELAEKVAALTIPVTKIIHSPLQRAKETARIVAKRNDLPLVEDARLIEMDYGIYDGQHNQTLEYLKARTNFATRFPGGESYFDMYARVYPLLKELQTSEETYLLVCHNAMMRTIHNFFEDVANEAYFTNRFANTELRQYD